MSLYTNINNNREQLIKLFANINGDKKQITKMITLDSNNNIRTIYQLYTPNFSIYNCIYIDGNDYFTLAIVNNDNETLTLSGSYTLTDSNNNTKTINFTNQTITQSITKDINITTEDFKKYKYLKVNAILVGMHDGKTYTNSYDSGNLTCTIDNTITIQNTYKQNDDNNKIYMYWDKTTDKVKAVKLVINQGYEDEKTYAKTDGFSSTNGALFDITDFYQEGESYNTIWLTGYIYSDTNMNNLIDSKYIGAIEVDVDKTDNRDYNNLTFNGDFTDNVSTNYTESGSAKFMVTSLRLRNNDTIRLEANTANYGPEENPPRTYFYCRVKAYSTTDFNSSSIELIDYSGDTGSSYDNTVTPTSINNYYLGVEALVEGIDSTHNAELNFNIYLNSHLISD